jgi:hypothetical protein
MFQASFAHLQKVNNVIYVIYKIVCQVGINKRIKDQMFSHLNVMWFPSAPPDIIQHLELLIHYNPGH